MAIDPFLDAHQLDGLYFELGGCFSPASIRDQMLRAYSLVQRLFDERLIDRGSRNLLVIGAGSTGMTAAIAAAELGVTVRVIEKRSHDYFRLIGCTTRDVDPTAYDWPADHWRSGIFPIAGAKMPLWWWFDRAAKIAFLWRLQLAALPSAVSANLTVDFRHQINLRNGPPRPKNGKLNVQVHDRTNGSAALFACGALVSCAGWISEKTYVKNSNFKGFDFWENDPLQLPITLPSGQTPRVLIAGGGDGAIQDFIRIATNKSAREVLDSLIAFHPSVARVLESVRRKLKDAEDNSQRALSWGANSYHDDPVLERLEKIYLALLAKLSHHNSWHLVVQAVLSLTVPNLPNIKLVHTKDFFHRCYGLNRFLGLLLLTVLHKSVQRIPNAQVDNVRGVTPHACHGKPWRCHLQPHEIDLTIAPHGTQHIETADVVVLRLGVTGNKGLFSIVPGRSRHMLPYFVE